MVRAANLACARLFHPLHIAAFTSTPRTRCDRCKCNIQGEAERQWQQHVSDVNAMLHLTFQQQSPLASAAFFESLAQDLEPFPGPALGCMPVSLLEPGSGDEIDSEASRELSMAFMEALSSQGLVSHPALPPPALHAGNSATTSGAGSTIMSSQCWADEREVCRLLLPCCSCHTFVGPTLQLPRCSA